MKHGGRWVCYTKKTKLKRTTRLKPVNKCTFYQTRLATLVNAGCRWHRGFSLPKKPLTNSENRQIAHSLCSKNLDYKVAWEKVTHSAVVVPVPRKKVMKVIHGISVALCTQSCLPTSQSCSQLAGLLGYILHSHNCNTYHLAFRIHLNVTPRL